jgi:hypothetical protein
MERTQSDVAKDDQNENFKMVGSNEERVRFG